MIDPKLQKQKDASEKKIISNMLNKFLVLDNRKASDILQRVSAKSGLPVGFLAANAFQEGMNKAIRTFSNPDSPELYHAEGNYPVDGYMYYGLDNFGRVADKLKEKGYIDNNLKYTTFTTDNEKGQEVVSAKFGSNEEALLAKAAMLKDFRDSVRDYSSKKSLKLEPKTEEYLTMAAYNGGFGNAKIMMDELSTGKYKQDEYVDQGLTSRKGVHKNIEPRMKKASWFNDMLSGPRPAAPVQQLPAAPTIFDALYRR